MKIDNSKGIISINSIIELKDDIITTYYNGYKLSIHNTRKSVLGHTLTKNLYGIAVNKFLVSENPEYTMEGNINAKFYFGSDIESYRVISFCDSSIRIITVQYTGEEDMQIYALYHMNYEGYYIVYFDPKKSTGNIIYRLNDKSITTRMHFRYFGNALDMCWVPLSIEEDDKKLTFKDTKKNMCEVVEGDDRYGVITVFSDHNIRYAYSPFIPVELNNTVTIFRDDNFWDIENTNKVKVTYLLEEDEHLPRFDQLTITVGV